MQKTGEISEYRDKLDKTLSSPELTDQETLKALLRNQLCSSKECDEDILDLRTSDVSTLLGQLRSASMTDHQVSGDWKLKHDNEDCRVMYREGVKGSPFHTLLVEGYMDGPVEECLCVSLETSLYYKWWPQYTFPPFRIVQNKCLYEGQIGEQVCLIRMKAPWPLMDREVIVHYFVFEYFKDGLVVILLNSISSLDNIGDHTKEVIPEAAEAVRIDVVGGFALQKVTPKRSYLRAIGDLDIKLDLLPPSLINFMSRQLIGNGFQLYKKSVAKFDEDYNKALSDPLYTKIRQALYSTNEVILQENVTLQEDYTAQTEVVNEVNIRRRRTVPVPVPEIEEEEEEEEEDCSEDIKRRFCVSPEVEQALGTLERVIEMVREDRKDMSVQEVASKEVNLVENIETVCVEVKTSHELSSYTKEEKEGRGKHGVLSEGKNSMNLQRKRKLGCFAFRFWLRRS